MFGAGFAAVAASTALSLFAAPAAAADVTSVDPIIIKGNHFFWKTNGTEFYIKGVAYQQDVGGAGNGTSAADSTGNVNFVDPLTDTAGCDRDIPLLSAIETNTIRVYAIDPTQNHDYCMNKLAEAGIYLIADLSAPNISINRDSPEWNMELYNRYTSVIDTMGKYTNTIGFFAGNEVSNNASNVDAIAFVKAAARDMKTYIKNSNFGRDMYVGYASDDDSAIRTELEDYLNCGPQVSDNVDFFGYNIYSWCDPSTYELSGYAQRTEELKDYSIPAFFAEYGCNTNGPRTWGETKALFSSEMTGVWSGGIVYEYFQEANKYGLVSVSGSSVSKLPDYTAYSSVIAEVSPTIMNAASYTPTNTALRSCPAEGANWDASPTLPPTPNKQLCDCMVSDLSCVAKSSVSTDAYGPLFNYICGSGGNNLGVDCSGISGNGSSGQYGAYSMCDLQSRLSWAMNEYVSSQKNNADACSFGGNATTQSGKASGTCAALVSGAGGVQGTGTSTASPVISGGSGGSNGASSSKSAAGMVTVPAIDMGIIKMGAYVVFAMAAGVGVVLM